LFKLLQDRNSLTIEQLLTLLPRQNNATVYRNIKVFEELGVVNRLQLGWHSKLELSDLFRHHHHHMSCTNCGKVIVLKEDPVIENQIASLGQDQGFRPSDHQLEIRGLCPTCQQKRALL
jgi:Fe2+ or Zn2+ uptake regulation protein